jgi:hypothetical protein
MERTSDNTVLTHRGRGINSAGGKDGVGRATHGSDRWSVAAGWMIQAWFDLGTSGGTFDPLLGPVAVFNGADDGNLMSFDGFFVRAEYGW